MKSTRENKNIKFPCLMEYKLCADAIIVLFNDNGCGTVLQSNVGKYSIGDYFDEWDMANFHYYNGKMVLEND